MASWRDGLSDEVQSDLDVLYAPSLDFAERALKETRSIHPFGIALTLDDQLQLHIEEQKSGIQDGTLLVRFAEEMLSDAKESFKSCALVLDTHLPERKSDAVEMRLEHREGGAIVIQVPYKFSGLRKQLTFGEMIVSSGIPRIWLPKS